MGKIIAEGGKCNDSLMKRIEREKYFKNSSIREKNENAAHGCLSASRGKSGC
jgi:hypothetical protein